VFPLEEALPIAERVKDQLAPFCKRIEIAGSIRRRKEIVGDIEVVAIPKIIVQGSFFKDVPAKYEPIKGFVEVVNQWERIKGLATGKYTQRLLSEGIKLDLFMATQKNWGLQFAIRTGSAKFSHEILAWNWVKQGYYAKNGLLYKDGTEYSFYEEIELFRFLKIPWVDPEKRM
jgi:DNA polymerase/3'-5' exonuclease PolX